MCRFSGTGCYPSGRYLLYDLCHDAFFPGGTLLKSYDLVHWEIAAHVFERLDDTPAEQLEGEQSIYGKGMWAASLRYHKDTFYVCFASYDTGKPTFIVRKY